MPGVSCKAVSTQNSSEWPCSLCPIPPGSGLWGWGHPIYIFLIFPGHLEVWTPLQIPSWGPPVDCTLLQSHLQLWNVSYLINCMPHECRVTAISSLRTLSALPRCVLLDQMWCCLFWWSLDHVGQMPNLQIFSGRKEKMQHFLFTCCQKKRHLAIKLTLGSWSNINFCWWREIRSLYTLNFHTSSW